MISVDFKSYNNYVTDSLYQWDLNRLLKITGLGVSVAPVIVFSNRHLERGIVVQSKLADGVITCEVPNALLQFSCPIQANLCEVSDQEYKAYETVLIPVIARVMPADYLYTDNVPILTYEAIKADLDVSISRLEITRASQDDLETERGRIDTLSARLDKAIAPGDESIINEYDVEMSDEVGGSVKIKTNGIHAIAMFNNISPAGNYSKNLSYTVGTLPSECLPFEELAIFEFNNYKIEIVNSDGDQLIRVTWFTEGPVFIKDQVCYALVNNKVNEIADIRVGADGTVYNSAGEAVRAQCGKVSNELKEFNLISESYDRRNLLENKATSQTLNGLTIEVKEDKTIVINGIPTVTTVIDLNRFVLNAESLILSGCPTGGSNSTYKLDVLNTDNVDYQYADLGSKKTFTPVAGNYRARIVIYAGVEANNLTFKPMLSKTNIPYEPYVSDMLSRLIALECRLSAYETQATDITE